MKKIQILFYLFLCLSSYAVVDVQIYHRFGEDGVGQTMRAFDSSGYKRSMSANTTVTTGIGTSSASPATLAQSTSYYTFSGTNCFLWPASTLGIFPATNFCMEAWIRVDSIPTGPDRQIFGDGSTGVANGGPLGLNVVYSPASGGIVGQCSGVSFGTAHAPGVGNWFHYAVVNDRGTNTFYVNGSAAGTSYKCTPIAPLYYQWAMAGNNGQTNFFQGAIDEYRLFTFGNGEFTNILFSCIGATNVPLIMAIPTWDTMIQRGTNLSIQTGETLKLQVVYKGLATCGVNWIHATTNIGSGSILTVTNVSSAFAGGITAVVTNSLGAATSSIVNVAITTYITSTPTNGPSSAQLAWQNLNYGAFFTYGPQTFDPGVTDDLYFYAPPSASLYTPTNMNCDQWVATAWNAGMKYVVLVAKHTSGFCLWPTKTSPYCVTNPLVANQTDVVKEVSMACKRYGLKFGVYLCLWDQQSFPNFLGSYPSDGFISVVTNQLTELLSNYGEINSVWLDGQWFSQRDPYVWNCPLIYNTIKQLQPNCIVDWNGGISRSDNHLDGVYPGTNGQPLFYFPGDTISADPSLPSNTDTKSYTSLNNGTNIYYLPFESPLSFQSNGYWFWHAAQGDVPRTMAEVTNYYTVCVNTTNNLLLNIPPNTTGLVPAAYSNVLMSAKAALGLQSIPRPTLYIH